MPTSRRHSWAEHMSRRLSLAGPREGSLERGETHPNAGCKVNSVHIDFRPGDAGDMHAEAHAASSSSKVRPETLDLHWMLMTANPRWTPRELDTANFKLNQIGVFCSLDLENALHEKGFLNSRLRESGFRGFASPTLQFLRSAVAAERERQRQANLLRVQRERRQLEPECKLVRANTCHHCGQSRPLDHAAYHSTEPGTQTAHEHRQPPPDSNDVDAGIGEADTVEECMTIEDGFIPCSASLLSRHSWDWPLTRQEKKERIGMIDMKVLQSYKNEAFKYKNELEMLKLKVLSS